MRHLQDAVEEFLASERIAVFGVARDGQSPANLIYRKLRAAGRRVFAVNPNATTLEGDPCYASVAAIPGGVDAAVVVTRPESTLAIVEACAAAGVRRLWLHRSFGRGSVSPQAVERASRLGLMVIPGGCPMMHLEPVDAGHACMRTLLRLTGGLPAPVAGAPARQDGGPSPAAEQRRSA
jgi:predicted CoA-binding protein